MSIEKYTWDGQDPKVVEKVHGKIVDMLTSGEYINYIALQKKPAVTLFPDSITLSNKRIFLCEFAKLGLATNFEIYSWQDIKDISFKEEIFGSKVTVIPFTGENLTVDYIPKVQARKLYQLIKESLENKDKKELSQKPEQVTPLHIPHPHTTEPDSLDVDEQGQSSHPDYETASTAMPSPSTAIHEEDDETTKKLTRLKNLFDRQLISQAEYESKKAEVLRDL